jgi:hypothetical protein
VSPEPAKSSPPAPRIPHLPAEDPFYIPEANGNDRRQRPRAIGQRPKAEAAPAPAPTPVDSAWRRDVAERPQRSTGIAAPLPSAEQVVQIMRAARRPLSGTDLWNSLPSPRPTSGRFRQYLHGLVKESVVTRTGHTRYELPGIEPAAVATPARTPAPAPPPAAPIIHKNQPVAHAAPADASARALPTGLTINAFKARLARFLLTDVKWTKPQHSGDLTLLIHDKWGAAPFDVLDEVLGELVDLGELQRTGEPGTYARPGQTKAQLPPLKAVEPTAPATPAIPEVVVPEQLLETLDRLLASGASYDARELARNLQQKGEAISDDRLIALLEQLHRHRRIERVSLMHGGTPRWRKLAGVSVRGKARASA